MLVRSHCMRVRLAAVLLLLLATTVSASAQVVVEDWSALPVGSKGIPAGW